MAFKVNDGGQSHPSERMRLRGDGRLGINSTAPDAPLDVEGYASIGTLSNHFNSSGVSGYGTQAGNISISAQYRVFASSFAAASDKRIKKDIQDVVDLSLIHI